MGKTGKKTLGIEQKTLCSMAVVNINVSHAFRAKQPKEQFVRECEIVKKRNVVHRLIFTISLGTQSSELGESRKWKVESEKAKSSSTLNLVHTMGRCVLACLCLGLLLTEVR